MLDTIKEVLEELLLVTIQKAKSEKEKSTKSVRGQQLSWQWDFSDVTLAPGEDKLLGTRHSSDIASRRGVTNFSSIFAYLSLSVHIASNREYSKPLVSHHLDRKVGHWDTTVRELSMEDRDIAEIHALNARADGRQHLLHPPQTQAGGLCRQPAQGGGQEEQDGGDHGRGEECQGDA